jgi:hypothetical protein
MDEPHPYQSPWNREISEFEKDPYPLGDLDFKPDAIRQLERSSSTQLINEYGWIWLWRNGTPSKLTVDVYNYYLGQGSTTEQNRDLQAYWLQLETEWLRSNTNVAGVLAFCYLANNYGYTGDWFTDDIRDLKPGKTMHWFRHCFAPAAVFLNLTDERYTKHVQPHTPGSDLLIRTAGINNNGDAASGKLSIRLLDSSGRTVLTNDSRVVLASRTRTDFVNRILLPEQPGGYLLVAEFIPEGSGDPVISRRYIRIGAASEYIYYDLKPKELK